MTAVPKNVYTDKLLDKHNNTYSKTIKVKPIEKVKYIFWL